LCSFLFTDVCTGHYLKPGDTVLGYHLANANFNDADLVGLTSQHKRQMSEIVLVRKSYPVTRRRLKTRHWKLKELEKEQSENIYEKGEILTQDYEMFLQDLEEDPEMRAQINLYKGILSCIFLIIFSLSLPLFRTLRGN
jgi:nonsense-mediated mRNA decay protein 3